MLHGPKKTQRRAAKLRTAMSLPEVLLWKALPQRPAGLKFRRQHPAGDYVLDFYCASAKLAVEVDGYAHDTGNRPAHDAARDAWIKSQNVRVLRIAAAEVLRDPDAVVRHIVVLTRGDLPLHQPEAGPPPLPGEE